MFNRSYIFKWLVFHCQVSFLGCNICNPMDVVAIEKRDDVALLVDFREQLRLKATRCFQK